jgi:tetratricopeptide (TPR) repeat protein
MKLHYASVLVVAGLVAAMPAHADGAITRIGQTPAIDCFNAANKVSHTGAALPDVLRNHAMSSCAEALTEKMTAKDRIATLVNRGTIEAASSDLDSAITDYNTALALNPKMADIYIDRGSALMRAARFEDARADFNTALSLGPTNTYIAYFDRGMAQEKMGDIKAAYQDYKQAASLAPDYQPAKAELSRFQTVVRSSGNG